MASKTPATVARDVAAAKGAAAAAAAQRARLRDTYCAAEPGGAADYRAVASVRCVPTAAAAAKKKKEAPARASRVPTFTREQTRRELEQVRAIAREIHESGASPDGGALTPQQTAAAVYTAVLVFGRMADPFMRARHPSVVERYHAATLEVQRKHRARGRPPTRPASMKLVLNMLMMHLATFLSEPESPTKRT